MLTKYSFFYLSSCSLSLAEHTTTCRQYLNVKTTANVSSIRRTEQLVRRVVYENAFWLECRKVDHAMVGDRIGLKFTVFFRSNKTKRTTTVSVKTGTILVPQQIPHSIQQATLTSYQTTSSHHIS